MNPALLPQAQTAAERFEALRGGLDVPVGQRLIGVLGIAVMIGIAMLMSHDRRRINWRLVASGVALQVVFGLLVLKTSVGQAVFQTFGDWITALLGFQEQGARFVFGNLVDSTVPVSSTDGAAGAVGLVANTGAFFAFNVLPTII
ncbi:MAG TPA: Na+ dependent nucleoside transporter N-terminal domain-containing protein, partial [Gemmatimonadales bacterium]|nr:Na+ dependent nucleoside transporter N-terminal domain-containing protein [Gemmatimonadales bacterium]